MHTWALFSCSSLITLTAYNLAQLPQASVSGPEPEPEPSGKFSGDAKFSLEALSQEFPEYEPTVALPPLPQTPQMSKVDELPGYNPAIYDPVESTVEEVDLAALLAQEDLSFPTPDNIVTYRADAVRPLPSGIPSPPTPLTARDSLAAIAALPEPVALPQAESPAASPAFAQSSPPTAIAQVPTPPSEASSQPTQPMPSKASTAPEPAAADTGAESPPHQTPEVAESGTPESELFAALPAATKSSMEANRVPHEAENLMAHLALEALPQPLATSPDSDVSMELVMARRQLVARYCERTRKEVKPDNRLAVCLGETRELAQSIPEAATAGTPMPGNVESPTRNKPAMGVW